MTTPAHRQTSLFRQPVERDRRFRLSRWGVITSTVVLTLVLLVVYGAVALVLGILHRNAERDALKSAATKAMPQSAIEVRAGFNGSQTAYAIGDVPEVAAVVLSAFTADWGGTQWNEIPDTATSGSRSYLSAGQDRILEVKAGPCRKGRVHCPSGGSTVVVEVSVGGPKS